MFKVVLLICSLLFSNPFRFVYTNGDELFNKQDSIMNNKNIDIRDLKINWYIHTSPPSNLVVRQYCLIDLIENKPEHQEQINSIINELSGGFGGFRIWSEGYTAWKNTKTIFYPWLNKFGTPDLLQMARQIETGFAATSYMRATTWYPAPFGSLLDEPLDSIGQDLANNLCRPYERIYVKNVTRELINSDITYDIDPMPINDYSDSVRSQYKIIFGTPEGFHFEYKNKTKKPNWTDVWSPIRIFTVPFIW